MEGEQKLVWVVSPHRGAEGIWNQVDRPKSGREGEYLVSPFFLYSFRTQKKCRKARWKLLIYLAAATAEMRNGRNRRFHDFFPRKEKEEEEKLISS